MIFSVLQDSVMRDSVTDTGVVRDVLLICGAHFGASFVADSSGFYARPVRLNSNVIIQSANFGA